MSFSHLVPCRGCGGALSPTVLDLGHQPLCNRFLRSRDEQESLFPLRLAACGTCGLVQLTDPVPASEMAPRFPWISYNEAEAHLDHLVSRLEAQGALRRDTLVGGVSYKDSSTLARMASRGATTFEIGAPELGLKPGRVEIDAVQDRLDEEWARSFAQARPLADILMVRHIVEHAHDLRRFLGALVQIVKPGGWLVFEAPDSASMIAKCDYAPVWEEHVSYFTLETLTATLSRYGLRVVDATVYPHPFENALVVITRVGSLGQGFARSPSNASALGFFERYEDARRQNREALRRTRIEGRPVALLGAGHLGCTWLNLMSSKGEIDFVVDDDPPRVGLFMPGSRLPILGSAALLEREVGLCLLGVNPLSEDRVVERNQAFTQRGGVFRSIFPVSRRSILETVS